MMKEKILVTSATGHVGFPAASELLALGFQVRAFVRNPNTLIAKKLKELGAELFVGDLNQMDDLRKSLKGVQRAFHCSPPMNHHLSKTVAFVKAAEKENLEHVVYLTQWLSSENHLSAATREHWLADQAIGMHKKVNYTIVNPGLFAFTYFFTKEVVAHFGMLPTSVQNASQGKEGLNAPPSEEDQGRTPVAERELLRRRRAGAVPAGGHRVPGPPRQLRRGRPRPGHPGSLRHPLHRGQLPEQRHRHG